MAMLIVAVGFGLAMIALAVMANARFRAQDRLPMQWSLSGTVNWTAPRVLALSFIPALGIGMLLLFLTLARNVSPRPGQEGLVFPTLVALGAIVLASQLLHLWLIGRTSRRSGG